jgi:hypothetical protein
MLTDIPSAVTVLEGITFLNNNKFFWGVTMLLLNFGSKFIIGDLGKIHEQILSNEIAKKLIIFSLFFVATRDIISAFILTVLYVLIIDGMLHEKRRFCIMPESMIKKAHEMPALSVAEYENALKIVKTYEMKKESFTNASVNDRKSVYEVYKNNVALCH